MSFVITLLLAQAGMAQVAAPEPDCANPVVQQELNYCAAQEFHEADAQLNAQWQVTTAEMHRVDEATQPHSDGRPGYFVQLLAAQRAWLAYRDAQCDSEGYLARGGSAEPMLVAGCRAALTRERTDELRSMISYLDQP